MPATAQSRRHQRAVSARVLLSLHANDNLQDPERWTWQALDKLPGWCLAGESERLRVQRVCGALYLSPELRYWIHKSALGGLQELLGSTWELIAEQADAMQVPREPVADLIASTGIDQETGDLAKLDSLLLAAGATVLRHSVDESLPRELLTESLGESLGEISDLAAVNLLHAANALVDLPGAPVTHS